MVFEGDPELVLSAWQPNIKPFLWVAAQRTEEEKLLLQAHGCGSKPMVPFWGRCTTHFSEF